MKRLSTFICYLLLVLGFSSFVMGMIGLSLTPFISGGVLVGLGVLIYYIRDLPQALREVAESIRYNAYVNDKGSLKADATKPVGDVT
jgi:hypothetical protein